MQLSEQYVFNGSEIWRFLSRLPMHSLCSYDLRMDELKQLVFDHVIAHVPPAQLDNFKYNFILQHYPESRLHNINRAQFELLFNFSLEKELRDTLVLGKSLLADISFKFDISLSEDNPNKVVNREFNDQFLALFRDSPVQIILGIDVTAEINKLLIAQDNRYRRELIYSKHIKASSRSCVTAENLQTILDLPGIGYEINLQHPKFAKLFRKLNEYRLTLSNEDHIRLFAKPLSTPGPGNKRVLNTGPFTLNRELAGDLLRCANVSLTHDQIRYIWLLLDEAKRKIYFDEEELLADTIIEPKDGISHATLLNLATQINHSITLTPSQNRQVLSNMTLEQLQTHYELSYKQGVGALENSLMSGSQYLSRQYSFSTSSLAQIISVITAYSFKISMVAAGAIAFVASISLGATTAIHQARETMRKEARERMQYSLNCFEINRLRQGNAEKFNGILSEQLEKTATGQTRFNQLVGFVERAGLAYPFENVIKSCRSIAELPNFSPMKIILRTAQQLNQMTLNLQDHIELISAHYETLQQRHQVAQHEDERDEISQQLMNTEYLLHYLQATRKENHVTPGKDLKTIYPLPANTNISARLKAMFVAPLQRIVHQLTPRGDGFQTVMQAVGAGLLFTIAVISMAMLFTAVVQTLVIVGACAVVVGAGLGAICYDRIQREKRSEAIVQRSEAIKLDTQDDSQNVDEFKSQCEHLRQIEQQAQVSPRLAFVKQNSVEVKSRNHSGIVPANVHGSMAQVIAENANLRQENTQLLTESLRQQEEILALKAQLAMQKSAPEPAIIGAGQSHFAFMKAPPVVDQVQVGFMKESMLEVERSEFNSHSLV